MSARFSRILVVCCLTSLVSFSSIADVSSFDLYIIYVSVDKKIQKSLKKVLSKRLKVKSYNASILLMADYSGTQKAVAKLRKAHLVVFVKEAPMILMGNPIFANQIIVFKADDREIERIRMALEH